MRPAAPARHPSASSSSYRQQEPRAENPLLLLPSSRAAKLSLGCPVLDRLLSGGLPAASVIEIAGESASGKTQLCLQLALLAPLSPLSASCLFLHSDLPFPLRRLRGLAPKSRPDLLDHVLVAAAHSPSDLISLLSRAQRLLDHPGGSPRRLPVRLILIDSIASLFRADFDASPADLKRRSALFFRISAKLKELAHRHQCVVVVTNQVVDVVEGEAGNTVAWSSGRRVSPALGLAWANCVNTRLFLTRDADGSVNTRRMKVAFAPHLPERACEFVIRRDGVFGVEPSERCS
ncbi:DNA repair protein XRCC3 homolog [Oryza brachyantha]|uniref:DNA repair protein XRCC3 homolog n=1 Tax=Oryza brachyantha TaxID=4533 RepID=UPI001ADB7B5F|nr:DNA repair protein XRCC3 homolog [Oryza brachyantha]